MSGSFSPTVMGWWDSLGPSSPDDRCVQQKLFRSPPGIPGFGYPRTRIDARKTVPHNSVITKDEGRRPQLVRGCSMICLPRLIYLISRAGKFPIGLAEEGQGSSQ